MECPNGIQSRILMDATFSKTHDYEFSQISQVIYINLTWIFTYLFVEARIIVNEKKKFKHTTSMSFITFEHRLAMFKHSIVENDSYLI